MMVLLSFMSLISAPSFAQDAAPSAEPPAAIPADPAPAIPAGAPPPPPTAAAPPPTVAAPPAPPPRPIAAAGGRTYEQGYIDGRSSAEAEPMGGWFAAGAGGACLASGIGCLGVTATAGLMEPRPTTDYLGGLGVPGDNDYWAGYREGYSKRLRTRRATSAFLGGTAMTAVGVGVAFAAIIAVSNPIYIEAP